VDKPGAMPPGGEQAAETCRGASPQANDARYSGRSHVRGHWAGPPRQGWIHGRDRQIARATISARTCETRPLDARRLAIRANALLGCP